MSEGKIISLLKKEDNKALKQIYLEHKEEFLGFSKKFSIQENDALDCYQDAIIALQEQAIKGNLDTLKSTIKTYLFGIGKYMMYEKARKNSKVVFQDSPLKDTDIIEVDYYEEVTEQQQKLQKGIQQLGKRCREVLRLFYYRGFTIDEIAEHLSYENKNVVKSQKSRCLKQLKNIING